MELLSRPANYVTWSAKSNDGKPHDVSVYFDARSEIATNEPQQEVTVAKKSENAGLVSTPGVYVSRRMIVPDRSTR